MRKRIDAHVHIIPERLLGTRDGFTTYCRNGLILIGNKFPYQNMPDIIGNSCFTPSTIVAVMDNAGVESCIVMQGFNNSLVPDAIGAMETFPGRFHAACRLDPARETLPDEIRKWHSKGITVLKCLLTVMPGFPSIYQEYPMNSERVFSGWKVAEELGMTVAIDAGKPENPGYDVNGIRDAIEHFPNLNFVICHMGLPRPGLENEPEAYKNWLAMRQLAKYPNVWFECSALSTFYIEEAYPFVSAQKLVKEFIDEFGDDKVLWGSDMPGTLNDGTYRQLIDTYDRSSLLTDVEKDKLFYDNAKAAYHL